MRTQAFAPPMVARMLGGSCGGGLALRCAAAPESGACASHWKQRKSSRLQTKSLPNLPADGLGAEGDVCSTMTTARPQGSLTESCRAERHRR